MKNEPAKINNIDEYIAGFPAETQKLLAQLREIIRKNAPQAQETISYKMPAYKYNGMLVYFAGYKNHIGFYPGGIISNFTKDIAAYKTSKGTIQLPLDKPLPVPLITKIVKFRIKQNLEKAALKAKLKK